MMQKIPFSILALSILTLLALLGSPSAWAEEQSTPGAGPDQSGQEYLLGPGDLIQVQVWDEPELSGPLRIRMDGRISLPLIGEITAAGQSPQALAKQLSERFGAVLAEASVNVSLTESNQRYYVLGKVSQPGEFPMNTPINVLQALARSGGFLEWAKTSDIRIIRSTSNQNKLLNFDYDSVSKDGDLENLPLLAPGDTIIVP
ncbi:MAG: sugar transporter [Desulfobulbaceae bacterium]|nr:MAG: sugar transporter [Desulfobulbaceae bacterium]